MVKETDEAKLATHKGAVRCEAQQAYIYTTGCTHAYVQADAQKLGGDIGKKKND